MGNEKVSAIAPGQENSAEYKLYNAKLFSLNEILSYSEYIPTDNDKEHFRKFDRADIEQLAKQKEGQLNARISFDETEAKKLVLEFSRYKQDCRKRAFDLAHSENSDTLNRKARSLVNENDPLVPPDTIALAEKYYQWLIEIPA